MGVLLPCDMIQLQLPSQLAMSNSIEVEKEPQVVCDQCILCNKRHYKVANFVDIECEEVLEERFIVSFKLVHHVIEVYKQDRHCCEKYENHDNVR